MSLQFVVGSPGSGKSTLIYNRIIEESIANPKKNYIIIVPEQFTMLTQKELVRLHPDHVIMNIDVLSFNRMAYRVFDELGVEVLDVLEESGKNLVIRKLAMERKDELGVLSYRIDKTGYIQQIKSFISELAQYNISSSDFINIINEGGFNSNFVQKATDISVIYKAYEDFIKDRYITAESLLVRLNDVIADSKMLKDSVFVFDSFTGFTPLQNQLLMTVLPRINKAYVVVTMDVNEPLFKNIKEYELYNMSKKMIRRTSDICKKCGVDIESDSIICADNYRFKSEGHISYIEKNIFRVKTDSDMPFSAKGNDLSIHLLSNPRHEIEYVASQIAKDVRESNRQYKDIAICVCDMAGYKDYYESIFSKYNIPFYLDCSNEITFHPVIEFIRSAFLVVESNFSYETLMQFLRCNLSGLSMDEVDIFDNYLNAAKVRGYKSYSEDFTYEPKDFKNRLSIVNDIKNKFIGPLLDFYSTLSNENTATDISKALYKLLCDYKVEYQNNLRAEELKRVNDNIRASECTGIYSIVISILDKIVALLGDDVMSPEEYAKIFLFACEGAKVSTIPVANDCVVIGDLERTRYDKPKVMYLMGVNDGNVPSMSHSAGIISQTERVALKEALDKKDADIAPSDQEKSFMQRFYVYMILTKASDKLCITYSMSDNNAAALNRSYLIDELVNMFDDIDVDVIDKITPDDYIVSFDSTKRYVASSLREFVHDEDEKVDLNNDDISAMLGLIRYCNDNNYHCYDNICSGAFYYHNKEEIDRALYDCLVDSKEPKGSVSRLESYRKCAYSYFVNYCLGINEREQGKLHSLDYGSIYHDILEEFSQSLRRENIKWKDLDDKKQSEFLDSACTKVYSDYNKVEILDSSIEKYALKKITTTMDKTIKSLVLQVKNSDFEPYGFEVELNEIASPDMLRMTLRDGRKMTINGRIDRIDTFEKEGNVYVKIIDYKSGNTSLDYEKIYNGLQLQLIYYLDVSVKGLSYNKTVKPGAIFYYHVKDPIVDYVNDSVENMIKADMIPSGLFFDEVDDERYEAYMKKNKDEKSYDVPGVLKSDTAKALDNSCSHKSLYAPFSYTKDGSLNGRDTKALSIDNIETLEKHITNKMIELGSDMYEGVIDASPIKDEGCKYCPYGGICGFDIKQPGYDYSNYKKLSGDKKDALFRSIGD